MKYVPHRYQEAVIEHILKNQGYRILFYAFAPVRYVKLSK